MVSVIVQTESNCRVMKVDFFWFWTKYNGLVLIWRAKDHIKLRTYQLLMDPLCDVPRFIRDVQFNGNWRTLCKTHI